MSTEKLERRLSQVEQDAGTLLVSPGDKERVAQKIGRGEKLTPEDLHVVEVAGSIHGDGAITEAEAAEHSSPDIWVGRPYGFMAHVHDGELIVKRIIGITWSEFIGATIPKPPAPQERRP
jgi:hypothetical protein